MAWPPPTLPTNRTNATPQTNTHAADHNALALAVNDITGYVQFLDTGAARRGVVVQQGGQSVAAGQVVDMSWSGFSETTFGTGTTLIVPAGAGGIYIASVELTGPAVPVGAHGDCIITMKGAQFFDYVPEGKSKISCCAMNVLVPGDGVKLTVYNPTVSSGFYAATMVLARVSAEENPMSYNTLNRSANDLALQNRVLAAVSKEAQANPEFAATPYGAKVRANPSEGIALVWPVCIDYEAEYAYAADHNNPDPGGDESVITDANIQAAVQAHWPTTT